MSAAASAVYQTPQRHAGTGGFGFTASRARGVRGARLGCPLLDEPDDAERDLLDRELRHLEHGAPEAAMDPRRELELVVDLHEVGVLAVAAHPADALLADLGDPLGVAREPDDLRRVDPEELV